MAKILVVEDEPDLRETIVEELNDEGHTTIEAGNGVEGLEKLAVETPDLILSDITMPQMNGYQFFRSIREKYPQHSQIPFMFLTALSDKNDELKGLRLGVDDYMTKPIDFDILVARVELALRRRQVGPAPTPAQPTASNAEAAAPLGQESQAEADKFKTIAENNGGRIQTGKFETVSLDAIREKLGDRWSEVSEEIMQAAELVIRGYLGPDDLLHIKPSRDFVVCFADLAEEEAAAKVGQIRDAIWEAIFAQTDNEELSAVDAVSLELSLDREELDDTGTIFCEIDDLVDEQKMHAKKGYKKTLHQIHQYEDIYALTLLGPKGAPTKVKMLAFEKKFNDRARKLLGSDHYEPSFLIELQQTLFERLEEKRALKEAFRQVAMLLPVHFSLMDDQEGREGLIRVCKNLERSMGVKLLIEIIDTPDRIKSHMASLKPLPVGRQVQFLELRRAAQMTGVELGELSGLGIAFVTMRFDHAMQEDKQSLRQVTQALERIGVKFFIKDIPEGRLFEAQSHHGQLYAMQR